MNWTPEWPRSPSFRLEGRRALVTGAGRGIGLGLAVALAEAGAEVTLAARSWDEVSTSAERLRVEGHRADAAQLDVTQLTATRQFVDSRPAYHILVNNAGTNRPKPATEVTEEDYDAVLGLNLKAAFFAAQCVARRMIAEKISGSLIHVSSQMGHVGGARRTLYCASKWGIEGMSKAMALDLAPFGIRSNTLAPTFVRTPLTQGFLQDPSFEADVLSRIKLGRLGRVEDLMGAAVLLASDAASLITGTSIVIDGGWTTD